MFREGLKFRLLCLIGSRLIAGGAVFCSLMVSQTLPGQTDFGDGKSEIPITSFRFIGPFRYEKSDLSLADANSGNFGLSRDYLKDYLGHSEETVDAAAFSALTEPVEGMKLPAGFRNTGIGADASTHILSLRKQIGPIDYAIGYAGTTIDSAREQNAVIAVGADDAARVWLNGELISAEPNTAEHGLVKFQRLLGVKLRKGPNFLLIKADNKTQDWAFSATLIPPDEGLRLAEENGIDPLLERSLVPEGSDIPMRGDLLPPNFVGKLSIIGQSDQPLSQFEVSTNRRSTIPANGLKANAVYRARLSIGQKTFDSPFFYGDLGKAYQTLHARSDKFLKREDAAKINVEAQLNRLEYLLEPGSRSSLFWQRNVVAAFGELGTILDRLEANSEAFKNIAGTHLRGYRSAIDGQVQHYWLHVPEGAVKGGGAIPVVVALPYTVTPNAPFLKSYFVDAFDEDERYRLLGDEYGFAVLQPWGRGDYHGATSIGMEDISAALKAVEQDYHIDQNRIYLLGYSEAGRVAMLMGERFPDRFAAIATEGPITAIRGPSSYRDAWLLKSSPTAWSENLLNTPVLILHDEADTVPIAASEAFVTRSRSFGAQAELKHLKGSYQGYFQDPMDVKRQLFEFFRGKQRNANPTHILLTAGELRYGSAAWLTIDAFESRQKPGKLDATVRSDGRIDVVSDNVREFHINTSELGRGSGTLSVWVNGKESPHGVPDGTKLSFTPNDTAAGHGEPSRKSAAVEGPISDAFGGPVLVVEGTGGSAAEKVAIHLMAEQFRASWKRSFFVDCPTRFDTAVTDDEIRTHNLVLIGDRASNSVLGRVGDSVPVKTENGVLTLGDRKFAMHSAAYIFANPNPFNPSRYLVVLGMAPWRQVDNWDLGLPRNGICDFFIWSLDGPKPQLASAGYFADDWKTVLKTN